MTCIRQKRERKNPVVVVCANNLTNDPNVNISFHFSIAVIFRLCRCCLYQLCVSQYSDKRSISTTSIWVWGKCFNDCVTKNLHKQTPNGGNIRPIVPPPHFAFIFDKYSKIGHFGTTFIYLFTIFFHFVYAFPSRSFSCDENKNAHKMILLYVCEK